MKFEVHASPARRAKSNWCANATDWKISLDGSKSARRRRRWKSAPNIVRVSRSERRSPTKIRVTPRTGWLTHAADRPQEFTPKSPIRAPGAAGRTARSKPKAASKSSRPCPAKSFACSFKRGDKVEAGQGLAGRRSHENAERNPLAQKRHRRASSRQRRPGRERRRSSCLGGIAARRSSESQSPAGIVTRGCLTAIRLCRVRQLARRFDHLLRPDNSCTRASSPRDSPGTPTRSNCSLRLRSVSRMVCCTCGSEIFRCPGDSRVTSFRMHIAVLQTRSAGSLAPAFIPTTIFFSAGSDWFSADSGT